MKTKITATLATIALMAAGLFAGPLAFADETPMSGDEVLVLSSVTEETETLEHPAPVENTGQVDEISPAEVAIPAEVNEGNVTEDEPVAEQISSARVASAATAPGAEVTRNGGSDRCATSYEVAKNTIVADKPLFVVTGANFPDALTAGAAAAYAGGSLILTAPGSLNTSIQSLIGSKKPSKVYVIGGSAVVSDNVMNQLKSATGKTPQRIYGSDRYQTAQKVQQTFLPNPAIAYVATGKDFPDALAASGRAGREGAPIILFNGKNAAIPGSAKTIKIAGGTGVIPTWFESNLRNSGKSVQRFAGPDRFATAQALQTNNSKEVWIANGMGFPDALSAAAVSGRESNTLILAKQNCIPDGAKKAIGTNTTKVHLVGGNAVLNEDVMRLKACSSITANPPQGDIVYIAMGCPKYPGIDTTVYRKSKGWTREAAIADCKGK